MGSNTTKLLLIPLIHSKSDGLIKGIFTCNVKPALKLTGFNNPLIQTDRN